MTRLDLAGKTVVITGGASGIGLALAEQMALRGAKPAILDVDGEKAGAQAARIGGGAIGAAADVTDAAALRRAIDQVAATQGGIDVLVANAGIYPRLGSVDSGREEEHARTLSVNLHGVIHTVRAGVPHLLASRGHLVVMSSVAAFVPVPGAGAYAMSKAAVEALARAARIELASTGVTVGVTHFGQVDTPLIAGLAADPLFVLPKPMRARARPEDVAQALARGIERRAARTIYPRIYLPQYALRGVLGPIADELMVRLPASRRVFRQLRTRDQVEESTR
ncbi:SDR family NAD(P)-dependent oxidoreductase [Mycobacterium sp. smrl_JER01]|uniref:SDR family NAD(P)-dependent oxidoreductase n=1 Tax=Mycobacterium sp. smrl_JER01 TaxID=3402633 RepID=UPI003AC1451B